MCPGTYIKKINNHENFQNLSDKYTYPSMKKIHLLISFQIVNFYSYKCMNFIFLHPRFTNNFKFHLEF